MSITALRYCVLLLMCSVTVYAQNAATIGFSRAFGETNSVVYLPVYVTTDSTITFAQFVIEFDSTVISPQTSLIEVGRGVSGFSLATINASLPFLPAATGANKNFLVQVSGSGSASFSGDSLKVLRVPCLVVGEYHDSTSISFDETAGRTFLTTSNLTDLQEELIDFRRSSFVVDDFTPPSLFALLSPPDRSWTNGSRPTLVWMPSFDSGSGLAYYDLIVDARGDRSGIQPAITSVTPAQPMLDGLHSWEITAFDSAGNLRESSSSWALRVDTTPPTSQIISPTDSSHVSGAVVVTGIASDAGIGVDSVLVSTDNGMSWNLARRTSLDFTSWEYTWQVPQSGAWMLLTMAVDSLGNRETPHGLSVTSIEATDTGMPASFVLWQNYPNPFNPETTLSYAVPRTVRVKILIFNLQGQEIVTLVDSEKPRGSYSTRWLGFDKNGNPAASGLYFYTMQAGEFVMTRQLLLLR